MVVAPAHFEDVFRQEYGRLVALGVAMTGSVDVARELAQETMLRAHDRWDEVGSYDAPAAWLRRVMSNLLIDEHRRRTSERRLIERLRRVRPTELDHVPGGSAARSWHELIEPLTDRQRLVASLHYADDLSIDEIAHTLSIAPGTVKSTLAKARRRIQQRLGRPTTDTVEGSCS